MQKKHEAKHRSAAMNLILGLALLFLAVILAISAVKQIRTGAVFSTVVSICGVLLFGAVGICLLVGEIRNWKATHK